MCSDGLLDEFRLAGNRTSVNTSLKTYSKLSCESSVLICFKKCKQILH